MILCVGEGISQAFFFFTHTPLPVKGVEDTVT